MSERAEKVAAVDLIAGERAEHRFSSRSIRSFVLRQGRMSGAQQRYLDDMLPRIGLPPAGPIDPASLFPDAEECRLEIGFGGGEHLIEQARANNVTLSAIAIGSDSDTELLSQLAQWGAGRYHFAARPADIPRLTLLESEIARTEPQVEGAFRAEQAGALAEGRYLGVGFANYIEPTTPAWGIFGTEGATIRIEPTGKVNVYVAGGSSGSTGGLASKAYTAGCRLTPEFSALSHSTTWPV